MDDVACVCDGQRAVGPPHLGQVVTVDVLHGKNDVRAEPHGRVGVDDILMLQPGGRLDLPEKPRTHAGVFEQVPADDLEDLGTPHEPVPREVDHPHPTASELTMYL